MLNNVKKVNYLIGLNKDILWSIYNKFLTIIKGPLTVFFIVKFLEQKEQGFWYTFISLGALSVFAELGFTSIITQFVSHEYAKLKKVEDKVDFTGLNSDKFFSLIWFSVRLYMFTIPIAIIIMIVIGWIYFKEEELNIIYPWIVFSIVGGMTLLLSLFQAIYKGLDKVKLVEQNILLGSLVIGIGNILFLSLNFKLWALVLGNGIAIFFMLHNLYKIDIEFWKLVYKNRYNRTYQWSNEILNLQWKYAVSWASGYFIFNMIIPFLFKYEGKIIAGQYGITFAIISASISLSQAWVTTKIPRFNILVAKKEIAELDKIFKSSFINALSIQILISTLLILLFFILIKFRIFPDRFLGLNYIIILLVIQIPIQIVNILAIYLRSYKEEPYMIYSVLNAVLLVFGMFAVLKEYDLNYFLIYLLIVYFFILLPYALIIFYRKKRSFKVNLF
jgi:O-antigen/teichoic acid export membrane protein